MNGGESGPVAIVDDEADIRAALRQMFDIEQIDVIEFSDGETALAALDMSFPGVVIADLRMPGIDGGALFNRLRAADPELPVIMMSGHGDIATAVDLVKRGAYDFLSKPFDGSALIATVRRALEKRSLVLENRQLRAQPVSLESGGFLGESPQIEQFRQTLSQLAQADIDVLITGESGSGKSLAAATLHRLSPRGRKSMITIDCGAVQGDHAESLLFGHVSGAFPGAQFPRTGQLLRADGGTVFLDHVEALSHGFQTRVLQALEDRAVLPMGSNQSQPSTFRTISASGSDIDARIADGQFDRSLFFRLGGYRLKIPPLHAREGDIVFLFRAFLANASAELKRELPSLSPAIWRKLQEHDWPGNVRELRSFAANVALGLCETDHSSPNGSMARTHPALKEAVAAFEADIIRTTLHRTNGDVAATILALNLPRKTFYDKLSRHRIDPNVYRIVRAK